MNKQRLIRELDVQKFKCNNKVCAHKLTHRRGGVFYFIRLGISACICVYVPLYAVPLEARKGGQIL